MIPEISKIISHPYEKLNYQIFQIPMHFLINSLPYLNEP